METSHDVSLSTVCFASDSQRPDRFYSIAGGVPMTARRRKVLAADRSVAGPRLGTTVWLSGASDVGTKGLRLGNAALHRGWAELLGRFPWELSVTLTLDPKRGFPTGRDDMDREAFWWCGYVGRVYRRPVGWAYALEQGRAGSWHAHALLVGVGDTRLRAPIATWEQRCGFIAVKQVANVERIALYTSKSVAWDGEITLSDTLGHYTTAVSPATVVALYP